MSGATGPVETHTFTHVPGRTSGLTVTVTRIVSSTKALP